MSNQSIKSKLREQTKKNHEEFRRELVEDVAAILKKWNKHSNELHEQQKSQINNLNFEVNQLLEQVKITKASTNQINSDTMGELKKLKTSHSWGYLILTVLVAIISTLTTLFAIHYLF